MSAVARWTGAVATRDVSFPATRTARTAAVAAATTRLQRRDAVREAVTAAISVPIQLRGQPRTCR
jgi:hypothetical protein